MTTKDIIFLSLGGILVLSWARLVIIGIRAGAYPPRPGKRPPRPRKRLLIKATPLGYWIRVQVRVVWFYSTWVKIRIVGTDLVSLAETRERAEEIVNEWARRYHIGHDAIFLEYEDPRVPR